MLSRTLLRREAGQVLYGPTSTLPRDFYACCENHFGMRLHVKTFIGIRASQQRGLFLSEDNAAPLEANQPIATIPLKSLYTVHNIASKPNALHTVSVEDVRKAIHSAEFALMAPQFYLGLQFSAIVSALPDISQTSSPEEMQRVTEVLRTGAMPWARMLDDEDFNADFIFGMYGMALDTWQRSSYEEMTKAFHIHLSSIHAAVQPPFKLEHFARVTRLILARAEHVPPLDYFDGNARVRRLRRRLRRLLRWPEPQELSMVPLLDLVNHSNRPNCGIRIEPSPVLGGEGAVTLVSLRRVQPGQELCRHYNFALSRASALFRYGFLPFDLISIVDHNAVDEYLVRNRAQMRPESEEAQLKAKKEADEVARLEDLFKQAKRAPPL